MAAAFFLVLGTMLTSASELQNWDPPSITVHPNHRAVLEGRQSLYDFVDAGRKLFITKFNRADGAGRPMATGDSKPTIRVRRDVSFQRLAGPDANSCAGCHNEPFIGGTGDFAANVFVGAHFTDPPTDSVEVSITNERNTIGMFGSGAIEMLAREMTEELQTQRLNAKLKAAATNGDVSVALKAKGISFGSLVAHPNGTFDRQAFQQLAKELFRGVFVSPPLHENIQDVAVLIDRPLQVVALAMDGQKDLIQVPFVAWSGTPAAQLVGIGPPKLPAPVAYRLIRQNDATFRHQLLDIPVAQAKAKIQPHAVADALCWEAMALIQVGW